jgi:pimeloyl-ACP methyl ester carboxylesterase
MSNPERRSVVVGDHSVTLLESGAGRPLLMLHDELGFPGWLNWNAELAANRRLVIPLQPGFGDTERVSWVRNYRDLASFYARLIRENFDEPIDVIGFSAGGYLAAEIAAADPGLFRSMVLVAPLGVRPSSGEILDFLAMTARNHVAATVTRSDAPEFTSIYGGEMTGEQFERFELARGETSRLGWEPFMFSESLPDRLGALTALPTLLVWGDADRVTPKGSIDVYAQALPRVTVETLAGAGHRPEIEDSANFTKIVSSFLDA